MLKKLVKISSKLVKKNPYWEYRLDEYTKPDGHTGDYHYVNSRGATMVVPLGSDGRFILLKQYRYLNSRESIEFPGGGIKEGVEPEDNAREELKEETGYKAGKLTKAGIYNPFNGVTNEICHVYIAEDLNFSGASPEDTEQFEILHLTDNEIIDLIKQGEIWDGMTLAAWTLYLYCKKK